MRQGTNSLVTADLLLSTACPVSRGSSTAQQAGRTAWITGGEAARLHEPTLLCVWESRSHIAGISTPTSLHQHVPSLSSQWGVGGV